MCKKDKVQYKDNRVMLNILQNWNFCPRRCRMNLKKALNNLDFEKKDFEKTLRDLKKKIAREF